MTSFPPSRQGLRNILYDLPVLCITTSPPPLHSSIHFMNTYTSRHTSPISNIRNPDQARVQFATTLSSLEELSRVVSCTSPQTYPSPRRQLLRVKPSQNRLLLPILITSTAKLLRNHDPRHSSSLHHPRVQVQARFCVFLTAPPLRCNE